MRSTTKCQRMLVTGITILMILTPAHLQAQVSTTQMSTTQCIGIGALEFFVPGLGYGVMGEFDKTLTFGTARWYFKNQVSDNNTAELQTDNDQIYQQVRDPDGKKRQHIVQNKETLYHSVYGSMDDKTGWISVWDLYEHGCTPNNNAYDYMLAPVSFSKFYDKWQFWAPIGLAFVVASQSDNERYHFGNGLTKADALNHTMADMYVTGLGEEALFRGVVQKELFQQFSKSFTPTTSRYLGIASASTIFGLLHTGTGTQATAFQATVIGAYLGYVYQPDNTTYDLVTAAAIHSWWNMIGSYYAIQNSDSEESKESLKHTVLPIVNFGFPF